jgi:hypothetical protein
MALAWQARVAEWIQSEEAAGPGKHAIAQNYSNFGFPVDRIVPGVSLANTPGARRPSPRPRSRTGWGCG